MIRASGPVTNGWIYVSRMRLARSGTWPGALGVQLSALERRRRLGDQQRLLERGAADYAARPPYPPRPRPPV